MARRWPYAAIGHLDAQLAWGPAASGVQRETSDSHFYAFRGFRMFSTSAYSGQVFRSVCWAQYHAILYESDQSEEYYSLHP